VISLLLSLLVIVVGGLLSPAPEPPSYHGRSPVVVIRPAGIRAGQRSSVTVLLVPPGAAQVRVITGDVSWPTRRVGRHAFSAHPVPPGPGPWELDIRFRLHNHLYTVLGTVLNVAPGY
jgi:hypothetical protein